MIDEFRGKYYFLSNFMCARVKYLGVEYSNNEAAFQAQKSLDDSIKLKFKDLNPNEAKSLGRRIKLRKDWESVKDEIMYQICRAKFELNPVLMKALIDTGNELLEEGNTWGDTEWGTVNGEGKNKLGKILMRIRSELRDIKNDGV